MSKARVPAKNVAKPVRELPKAGKHGNAKYVAFAVLATLVLGGYAFAMVLTGYTLQDVMRGMYSPFMVVSSQSMQPVLNYGDLIIVRKEPAERIMVGDIIAFNVPSNYDRMVQSPVIHRVVDKWTENGEVYFKTRGDNNPYEDPWDVPAENVVGKYALKVPYIGLVVLLLKQPPGVALVGFITVSLLYSYLRRGKVG